MYLECVGLARRQDLEYGTDLKATFTLKEPDALTEPARTTASAAVASDVVSAGRSSSSPVMPSDEEN